MRAAHSEILRSMGVTVWKPRGAVTADPTQENEPDRASQVGFQGAGIENDAPGADGQGSSTNVVARMLWPDLENAVHHCTACELHRSRTRTVFGVGAQTADLMIIGEAPGQNEDLQGEPFVGRAGKLLNAMLLALGLNRDGVYITNTIKCRPPGNRDPNSGETARCAGFLARQVELVQPRVILALGRVAAQTVLASDVALGKLRGQIHRYPGTNVPLIVTYHPAYLLRSPGQKGRSWSDLLLTKHYLDARG